MVLIPVYFFSCKKETDEIPPTIEVSRPIKNESYDTFDTIFVEALVKDNQKLRSVSAELLDADLKTVITPFSKTLDSPEYEMNTALIIDNIHLTSGKHYLLITASDENNTSKSFTEIRVNGLPLLTKGYMVYESEGAQVKLHQYINGTDSIKWQNEGPFKDGLIDNYYQQAGYLRGTGGPFSTLPLFPFIGPWELPPDEGGITFCRSQPDQIGIQIGYKNGIMSLFIEEGNLRKTYQSGTTYYPALSLLNDDNVIIWQVQDGQSSNRIEVFYFGGTIRQVSPFNPTVINLVNKNNTEIYIGANENGNGKLISYGLENGLFTDLYEFSDEPVVALCKGKTGMVYLSTSAGIYRYNDQVGNPISPVPFSDIPAVNLDWDFVNEVLVVTTEDELFILNSSGAVLQSYPLNGNPEKLQVWYSK